MKKSIYQDEFLCIYPLILELLGIDDYPKIKKKMSPIIHYLKGWSEELDKKYHEFIPIKKTHENLNFTSPDECDVEDALLVLTSPMPGDQYLSNRILEFYYAEDGTDVLMEDLLKLSASGKMTKETIIESMRSMRSYYHSESIETLDHLKNHAFLDRVFLIQTEPSGFKESLLGKKFNRNLNVVEELLESKSWSQEGNESIIICFDMARKNPHLYCYMDNNIIMLAMLIKYFVDKDALSYRLPFLLEDLVRQTFGFSDILDEMNKKEGAVVDAAVAYGALKGKMAGSYQYLLESTGVNVLELNTLYVIHKHTLLVFSAISASTGVKHEERSKLFNDIFCTENNYVESLLKFSDSLYELDLAEPPPPDTNLSDTLDEFSAKRVNKLCYEALDKFNSL